MKEDYPIKYNTPSKEDKIFNWIEKYYKWVIIGLLIFGGLAFYFAACKSNPVTPAITIPTKQVVKQVNKSEEILTKRVDSLQASQKGLVTKNVNLEKKLAAAQSKVKELAKIGALNFEPSKPAIGITDTSPQDYAADLTAAALTSDSLCNEVVSNLHQQITLKDSTITLQDEKYNVLRQGFDQVVKNDSANAGIAKYYKGKYKWGKVKEFGFIAAIIALAAKLIFK